VETRNFHDYSRWKVVFESNGFAYQPHLNFHVDTSSPEVVDQNLGKSRKRDIRTTIRDGVTPVYQPTIEQVRAYYDILLDLYKTKVKTPLFKWEWFEQLYKVKSARFILTELEGKIVGGTVCVELKDKALYEWFACGIDGVYPHIYPSTYATYLGIKYAAENGCQIFDMMGAGKPDEAYGVRDFKAKFGGEIVEHGRYLCIRKPLLYKLGKLGVKLLKR
jgi:lipid II:glycine glycyltransferase (peptidoglycan interpeptide bridge formation enzyme)